MVTFPHCKINLGLHVVAKRADGYHELETCFYPIPLTDVLEIIKANQFQFTSSGISIAGNETDNQCVKAYQLLQQDFDLPPVKIHLHKIIPTGAGLGGGSSDGAFTLRLLNEIFSLQLSAGVLRQYAAQLGSDNAFFIEDSAQLGTGRGEVLTPIETTLKGLYLILVNPNIFISTASAYTGITPQQPVVALKDILKTEVSNWKEKLHNDFEKQLFLKHPKIGMLKEKLYAHGALYASMSGSGASVFGIFDSEVNLKREFSECFYWAAELN